MLYFAHVLNDGKCMTRIEDGSN